MMTLTSKRWIKLFVSILIFGMLCFSAQQGLAASSYDDTETHWAKDQIERWSALGVIQGDKGKFRPNDAITRAELSVILDKLMKYQTESSTSFVDLPTGKWYTAPILRTNGAGVIQGSDGYVRPNDYITREETAVMICRALGMTAEEGLTTFEDGWLIHDWAVGYVKALAGQGFIAGVGGNRFAPTDNITRAAVVTLLDNVVKKVYDQNTVISENVTGNVLVSASGVTLKNMTITGDLYLTEGIGNGGVTLSNVKVTGRTIVKGGGKTGLSLESATLASLYIINQDNTMGVYISQDTLVRQTYVLSRAALEEESKLTGQGFRNVQIGHETLMPQNYSGLTVTLEGSFQKVASQVYGADLKITGKAETIAVTEDCMIGGEFSYNEVVIDPSVSCVLNAVTYTGKNTASLLGGAVMPAQTAKVGDELTAAPIYCGNVGNMSYQWFYADSNIDEAAASGWYAVSGGTQKTLKLTEKLRGKYLKAVVTASAASPNKLHLKLPYAVNEDGGYAGFAFTIENKTSTETTLKLKFTRPLALRQSSGKFSAVPNNYDFASDRDPWFAVRINNSSLDEDNTYISKAIYATADNSITITLQGNAAQIYRKVTVKIRRSMYDTYGTELTPQNMFTAVRLADVEAWQDGGRDGKDALDTKAPSLTIDATGSNAAMLKLISNKPLGYITNDVVRKVPNGYNMKNLSYASNRLYRVKISGAAFEDDTKISSIEYLTSDQSMSIRLTGVSASNAVTIAPLQPLYDQFGNALSASKSGVYYRRANETTWYWAANQNDADLAVAGDSLNGNPEFKSGTPAAYGREITVGPGTLSIQSNLIYTWYRSTNKALDGNAVKLKTGATYIPEKEDIGKYLIVEVKPSVSGISGTRTLITGIVSKATPAVTTKDITVTAGAGSYNLDTLGLFKIAPTVTTGLTYRIVSGPDKAHIQGNMLSAVEGEYMIGLTIAESDVSYAVKETMAKLIVSVPQENAPQTFGKKVTVLPVQISPDSDFNDNSLGCATYKVTNEEDKKIFVSKSVSQDNSAEILPLNSLFTDLSNYAYMGKGELTENISGAVPGYYKIVQTDAQNLVLATGVFKVEEAHIVARVKITNNSEYTINRLEIVTKSDPYVNSEIVEQILSGGGETLIYIPLDAKQIKLYSSEDSKGYIASFNSLTFSNNKADVTVQNTNWKAEK